MIIWVTGRFSICIPGKYWDPFLSKHWQGILTSRACVQQMQLHEAVIFYRNTQDEWCLKICSTTLLVRSLSGYIDLSTKHIVSPFLCNASPQGYLLPSTYPAKSVASIWWVPPLFLLWFPCASLHSLWEITWLPWLIPIGWRSVDWWLLERCWDTRSATFCRRSEWGVNLPSISYGIFVWHHIPHGIKCGTCI